MSTGHECKWREFVKPQVITASLIATAQCPGCDKIMVYERVVKPGWTLSLTVDGELSP